MTLPGKCVPGTKECNSIWKPVGTMQFKTLTLMLLPALLHCRKKKAQSEKQDLWGSHSQPADSCQRCWSWCVSKRRFRVASDFVEIEQNLIFSATKSETLKMIQTEQAHALMFLTTMFYKNNTKGRIFNSIFIFNSPNSGELGPPKS